MSDGKQLDKQFEGLSVQDLKGGSLDGAPEQSLPWLLGASTSPLEVWATSATDDVRNGSSTATWSGLEETSGGGIRLLAAKGERISFQIGVVLKAAVAGIELSVTCKPLVIQDGGKDGLRRTSITPDKCTLRRQMPPDALIPVPWGARVSLTGTQAVYLWVSIDVPATQEPGTYKTTISVSGHVSILPAKQAAEMLRAAASKAREARNTSDADEVKKVLEELQETSERVGKSLEHGSRMLIPEGIDVIVKVVDVAIPITPTLPVLCGLSEEILESRWQAVRGSKEWQDLFNKYFRFLLQYRMSPYFCRWKARGEDMGLVTYTSPYPLRSKETEDLLSLPQLAVYLAPTPLKDEEEDSEEDCDPGNPSLDELQALTDSPHWDKAMFYLFDEPTTTKHYQKLRDWTKQLLHEAPDSRVLTTYYCGPKDLEKPDSWESLMKVPKLLKDCTKVFCVSQWALGEDPKNPCTIQDKIKEEAGESAEYWSYVCMGPGSPHPNWHLQMSGGQHRAVAWRTWREGAKGLLYWGANCYSKDGAHEALSPISWREGLPPGDGVLLYPGERYGAGAVPVASVRLERALIGFQDVEYLNMHAALYGRAASEEVMTKTTYRGPRAFSQRWGDAEKLKAILADDIVKAQAVVNGLALSGPIDAKAASKPSGTDGASDGDGDARANAAAAGAKLRG